MPIILPINNALGLTVASKISTIRDDFSRMTARRIVMPNKKMNKKMKAPKNNPTQPAKSTAVL